MKGPIRHSEGPASAPHFAKLTFSETDGAALTIPLPLSHCQVFGQLAGVVSGCVLLRFAVHGNKRQTASRQFRSGWLFASYYWKVATSALRVIFIVEIVDAAFTAHIERLAIPHALLA